MDGEILGNKGSEDQERIESRDPSKRLKRSIDEMEEGSRTISRLRSFAKELSKSLEEPVGSMNVLREMTPATLAPPFAISPQDEGRDRSPARTLMDYYRMIRENRDEQRTLVEVAGKTSDEIERDLNEAMEADIESEFNFMGYRFLYELECFLRDIIQEMIVEPNQKNLGNFIPKNILELSQKRKEIEESSSYTYGSYRWIDYCDFNDLKTILEKGKNRRYLSDILDEEQFKCMVSKLHELDPIRKKIAHSRSLTKEEFNRLSMYSEDISRMLGEKEDQTQTA
jgi:hypothetical protein